LLDALRHGPRGSRARLWQLFYFGEAILLWDWMRSLQLRHVHAHHANVASDLAMLAAAFGSRASSEPWTWSFTLHGPAELLDVDGHKLGLKATRADSVVCVSDFARAQLMALTPPSTWSKLEVVHCGVDPEEFPPVRRARRRGDRFEVLTVARLEDRKGHDVLLDAVLELERRGIELRLTLAGDGPARDRLRLRVAESGLGEVVELIGPVGHEHVARLHAQADAFCLPSFAEGVPVVLMEAMASGLPVIATRITGVPELVEDGVSGLLVAPGRPSALADAIERVIVEPSLAPALGAAARARVLDGFDIRASAEQLHGLFVRLAGTGSLARTR
jgi:glycosyltransferase involved in cell wall biosynthesis